MNKDNKWFTIPGTEVKIPIMDIKGKDYLQVAHRLVWFNLEKPDWSIETEVELDTPEWIRVKCTIKDPSGRIMRTARKSKRLTQDKDADSCETGAIGRCLGLLGYGTQYAGDDLDEGDVVDAPQEGVKSQHAKKESKLTTEDSPSDFWKPKTEAVKKNSSMNTTTSTNEYVISFGKYKGQTLSQAGKANVDSYISWLTNQAKVKGEEVSDNCKSLTVEFYKKWPIEGNHPPDLEDTEPPLTSYDEEIPF